jgi:hypothetical protein
LFLDEQAPWQDWWKLSTSSFSIECWPKFE